MVEDWLIDYFSKNNDLSSYKKEDLIKLNYFETGFIDSFGVINLIMEIEKKFNLKFANEVFQDRRFPTIQGLTEIISEIK